MNRLKINNIDKQNLNPIVKNALSMIGLIDEENFFDDKCNRLEIRGERNFDNYYFKVIYHLG